MIDSTKCQQIFDVDYENKLAKLVDSKAEANVISIQSLETKGEELKVAEEEKTMIIEEKKAIAQKVEACSGLTDAEVSENQSLLEVATTRAS